MRVKGSYETPGRSESVGLPPGRASFGGIPSSWTGRTAGPSRASLRGEAELEHARWDPKDGELCLSRSKPEEILVEDRSDSDVQIDRQTWV